MYRFLGVILAGGNLLLLPGCEDTVVGEPKAADVEVLLPALGWASDTSNVSSGVVTLRVPFLTSKVVDASQISASDWQAAFRLRNVDAGASVAFTVSLIPSSLPNLASGGEVEILATAGPGTYALGIYPRKVGAFSVEGVAAPSWPPSARDIGPNLTMMTFTVGPCLRIAWCRPDIEDASLLGYTCGLSEGLAERELTGRVSASVGAVVKSVATRVTKIEYQDLGVSENALELRFTEPQAIGENIAITLSKDIRSEAGAYLAGTFADTSSCNPADFTINASPTAEDAGKRVFMSVFVAQRALGDLDFDK